MSKFIELSHELHGFHPGNEGSAIIAYEFRSGAEQVVSVATKYAVPFDEDEDGWVWAPSTFLNTEQVRSLRDTLSEILGEM